jgi:serine/threonine protein kinase
MESHDLKTQVLASPGSAAAGPPPDVAAILATRHEVLNSLGEGGMGLVYRVRDRETNEILALKLLRPEIARDPAMMERFKDEIRLARRITHKNVCRIYDFNRVDDLAYLTMEFVDGESLRAYLKRAGKLSPERVVDLARQIAAGLGEAHAQGVVHRDLKPENVMLARDGLVKLMDFGIARALEGNTTTTQTVIGTPGYMAPEQSQGKGVDQRTDLYALGLILYECLTGRRAFAGATPVEVALKQIKERPVPPRQLLSSTPPHLEAIVMRCLEKEPSRRFASAAELLRALTSTSESSREHAPRWRKLAAISAVALLAVVVAHKTVKQAGSSPQPAAPVQTESTSTNFQDRVGRLYLDGPERARDERKAFFWTRRASLAGDRNAQFMLAGMYESGRGVTQNKIGAYVWYSVAAASGSEPAREAFDRLKRNLSSDEIAAAEQRLRVLRGGQEH